jgi:hypothetical protein
MAAPTALLDVGKGLKMPLVTIRFHTRRPRPAGERRRAQLIATIERLSHERGRAPSCREVGLATAIPIGSVAFHVRRLRRELLVSTGPGGVGLVLTERGRGRLKGVA